MIKYLKLEFDKKPQYAINNSRISWFEMYNFAKRPIYVVIHTGYKEKTTVPLANSVCVNRRYVVCAGIPMVPCLTVIQLMGPWDKTVKISKDSVWDSRLNTHTADIVQEEI